MAAGDIPFPEGTPTRTIAHMLLQKTRADLDIQAFETAIEQHGNDLLWERASPCPCQNTAEGDSPQINCPLCRGLGYEHWGRQNIRGVIASQDLSRDFLLAFGQWSRGTALITVRGEHTPNDWDRLTNVQGVKLYGEWFTRKAGEGELEELRYPIAVPTYSLHPVGQAPDINRQSPEAVAAILKDADASARASAPVAPVPLGVLRLRLQDPATRGPGRLLECGVDFDVADGRIRWAMGDARGTAPAVGQRCGITYFHHPRYIVVSFDHVARDQLILKKQPAPTLKRFPILMLGKLDYLMEGFK